MIVHRQREYSAIFHCTEGYFSHRKNFMPLLKGSWRNRSELDRIFFFFFFAFIPLPTTEAVAAGEL